MACIRFWQSSVIQSLNSLTVLKWKLLILTKCSSMSILVKRMITLSLEWAFHFIVGPARNATSHQASFCWHLRCTMNLHFHTLVQGYPHKGITRVQNHYQFLPHFMLSQYFFSHNKYFPICFASKCISMNCMKNIQSTFISNISNCSFRNDISLLNKVD